MQKRIWARERPPLRAAMMAATVTCLTLAQVIPSFAQSAAGVDNLVGSPPAATPIRHIIVIIGENRTFDHVFATYKPQNGQSVWNLLSEGIVTADGKPGPNYRAAQQVSADQPADYRISPRHRTLYTTLPPAMTDGAPSTASNSNPPPFGTLAYVQAVEAQIQDGLPSQDYSLLTTGATGLPADAVDTRVKNATALPNGPFQLTGPGMPYDAYTASPVHRFYQMWQETDCAVSHITAFNPSGCLNKQFPWVETHVGTGGNGEPQAANFNDETTGEGSTSMGFYNMAEGDAPVFKSLADAYTLSDNFHQSIMGGTGANHIALGTGLAIYYSDGQGHIATPPEDEIEDPNSQPGTNDWWVQDGY